MKNVRIEQIEINFYKEFQNLQQMLNILLHLHTIYIN